jgi:hypothetical protein
MMMQESKPSVPPAECKEHVDAACKSAKLAVGCYERAGFAVPPGLKDFISDYCEKLEGK